MALQHFVSPILPVLAEGSLSPKVNPSTHEPLKPRHEVWRTDYRSRRYLELASLDELIDRFRATIENTRLLAPDGKLGLHKINTEQSRWWQIMTHILEEVSLRGLDHRALGGERLAQGFSGRLYHASSPPAAAALRATKLPPEGSFLAKLAERKYMEPLLKGTGTLKVAPASKFDDRSLNPATRDNELSLTVKRPGREVSVRNADGGTFRPVGTVSFTTVTQSDYYVCCFAEALPLRLFDDFKSDSALVVHNPKEFFRRVDAAVKLKLGEGWKSRSGRVTYLDPYHSPPAAQVYFAKLFDFSYQREHRFVWLPPTSMKPGKLEFLSVNPGRLDDIGFLINI